MTDQKTPDRHHCRKTSASDCGCLDSTVDVASACRQFRRCRISCICDVPSCSVRRPDLVPRQVCEEGTRAMDMSQGAGIAATRSPRCPREKGQMARRWRSNRNDAGSLLASVFILTLGAGCALFTVAAMSPDSMPAALWTVGSIVGIFIVIVVLQRFGKLPKTDLGFLVSSQRNRPDDGASDYQPRKVGEGRITTSGTNQPISVEEAKDLKVTSLNTWVPSKSRGAHRRASGR